MNKRGQFFLLAAVIILSVIVSLVATQNYVIAKEVPKKFEVYATQLQEEAGKVINYALYNNISLEDGRVQFEEFLQMGINNFLISYPEMDVYFCYLSSTDLNALICQNRGHSPVKVILKEGSVILSNSNEIFIGKDGGQKTASVPYSTINISNNTNVTIEAKGHRYNVDLINSSIQPIQFYLLFYLNDSSGVYVSQIALSE